MAILEVEHLSVAFQTDKKTLRTAVRDVSFQVDSGSILGIVGESGCGKSVTASAIMGLLPRTTARLTGGSIRLDGRELTNLSDRQMREIRGRKIAMIFQDPITSLNPAYPIGWQMAEMLCAHERLSKSEARQRSIELLRQVGVADPQTRIKDFPHQLSGGMSQRVMIAMALSANPQVLIADEPTTALDVTIQAQVLDLMTRLQKELHTAVLLITHDMGVVADMADHVLVMYAGQVVEYAPMHELFGNPRHPYTQGLLRSLPRIDRDQSTLFSIEGTVPSAGEELPGCRFAPRCPHCTELCHTCPPQLHSIGQARIRCHLYHSNEEAQPCQSPS